MGDTVTQYTYDAWGEVLSVTGSLASSIGRINPFRYRGYYYDTETGFYYLQSRYYDPVVGRFLNADKLIYSVYSGTTDGFNRHSYGNNNPINRIDSFGNLTTSYNTLKNRSWLFKLAKNFGVNFELLNVKEKVEKPIFSIDLWLIKLQLSISVGLTKNYRAGVAFNFSRDSIGVASNVSICNSNFSIAYSYNVSWTKISKSMSLVYCSYNDGVFVSLNLEFQIHHIATAGLVAACYFAPQFIPALAQLLANSRSAAIATMTSFAVILKNCYA